MAAKRKATPKKKLSLSQRAKLARMIRVNHAGEFGAQRIYAGQIAVLGKSKIGSLLHHMAAQEDEHLRAFETEMVERKVRPTALYPFWQAAGYGLGFLTAKMGEPAAMACTVAVEEVIDEHYQQQLDLLADFDEPALVKKITQFRADEIEHKHTALGHGAEAAALYPLLRGVIRWGAKAAIWLAERV